jgi:hypothetical protein
MAMLVGFHTEGFDHLILRAFLAKILGIAESEIEVDWIDAPGRGWDFVLEMVPKALKRFYARGARFAVVGIDNDGSVDLDRRGVPEDSRRPRHWLHESPFLANCRYCQLAQAVARTTPELTYMPQARGGEWPVLIAVPVEAIEAWLLTSRALLKGRPGDVRAEGRPHGAALKQSLYGRPAAIKTDVENTALPIIRAMTSENLATLRWHSRSFAGFAEQVTKMREKILRAVD